MKDWYWTDRARQADIDALWRKNKLYAVLRKLKLIHPRIYGDGHSSTIYEAIKGFFWACRYNREELYWCIDKDDKWFTTYASYYDGYWFGFTFLKIAVTWRY